MTLAEVRDRLDEIRALAVANDFEAAHGREDSLWRSVLVAVSEGDPLSQELADWALQSEGIEFERWCA